MGDMSAQQDERLLIPARAGETAREAFERSGRRGKAVSKAIGVRCGEQVFDLLTPLPADGELEPFAANSADGLDLIRHSTAVHGARFAAFARRRVSRSITRRRAFSEAS